jgi:hypothetical protein
VNATFDELLLQMLPYVLSTCEQNNPRGCTIKTMYRMHGFTRVTLLEHGDKIRRSGRRYPAGMYQQSSRLVNGNKVFIFIQNNELGRVGHRLLLASTGDKSEEAKFYRESFCS